MDPDIKVDSSDRMSPLHRDKKVKSQSAWQSLKLNADGLSPTSDEKAPRSQTAWQTFKQVMILTIVFGTIAVVFVATRQTPEEKTAASAQAALEAERSAAAAVIDQMERAYQGSPLRSEIERTSYSILELHKLEPNATNLKELGDVLVYLRKAENGARSEMDMMRCMESVRRNTAEFNMGWKETAALCSTLRTY